MILKIGTISNLTSLIVSIFGLSTVRLKDIEHSLWQNFLETDSLLKGENKIQMDYF